MSHDHSRSWSFYLVKYEPRSLTFSSRSLANHNKNYVIGQNICLKWMQNRNICFYILNWNGNLFLVKLLEEIEMCSYFQAYFWQILAHKMNLKWTKKWTELGQRESERDPPLIVCCRHSTGSWVTGKNHIYCPSKQPACLENFFNEY